MASPGQLYKYCSITDARHILESRSLRWEAAHLLHDPLALNYASTLSFTHEQFLYAAVKTAAAMIFAKEPPSGSAPLMVAIRRWRDEERFGSVEEAEEVLQELMSQMTETRKEALKTIMNDWLALNRRLRICQFTAKPDNFYAWQEMAEQHHGVILRFSSGESAYFKDAQPVNYSDVRPEITSLKEQLDVLLANVTFEAQKTFAEKFLIKPSAVSYQQEVRCLYEQDETETPIDPAPATWFIDREFGDSDLKAVHFGLATSLKDKQILWDFVKKNYSQVKFFQTKLFPGKFTMDSERLTEKPK